VGAPGLSPPLNEAHLKRAVIGADVSLSWAAGELSKKLVSIRGDGRERLIGGSRIRAQF
jgi:hypothetical protein